jgi:hypothetical protein
MLEPQPFKASEARLRNFSLRLANHLARPANDLAGLSKGVARPANDSINGVFDEKPQNCRFWLPVTQYI